MRPASTGLTGNHSPRPGVQLMWKGVGKWGLAWTDDTRDERLF